MSHRKQTSPIKAPTPLQKQSWPTEFDPGDFVVCFQPAFRWLQRMSSVTNLALESRCQRTLNNRRCRGLNLQELSEHSCSAATAIVSAAAIGRASATATRSSCTFCQASTCQHCPYQAMSIAENFLLLLCSCCTQFRGFVVAVFNDPMF